MPLGVEQLESRLLPSFSLYSRATGLPYAALNSAVAVREMVELNPAAEALLHPPPLVARPDPERPGDPAKVQAQVMLIALPAQQVLADRGVVVDVYRGTFVTDLPRYAGLADVATGADGDGGRTYSQVPAMTLGTTSIVAAGQSGPTVHEIGHALQATLPPAWLDEWARVFDRIDWKGFPGGAAPLDYFRLNQGEAFAESFRLWVVRSPALEPAIRSYFDALLSSLPG